MKATEIIKQYNLKYDTASGHYKRESKNKNDVIYELIEVNEDYCLFFSEYPLLGNSRSCYAIENDLPALEHWESDPEKGFKCSRCGGGALMSADYDENCYTLTLSQFCPYCGAKMDIYDESENE